MLRSAARRLFMCGECVLATGSIQTASAGAQVPISKANTFFLQNTNELKVKKWEKWGSIKGQDIPTCGFLTFSDAPPAQFQTLRVGILRYCNRVCVLNRGSQQKNAVVGDDNM